VTTDDIGVETHMNVLRRRILLEVLGDLITGRILRVTGRHGAAGKVGSALVGVEVETVVMTPPYGGHGSTSFEDDRI
jgi:hypothetical protein